MTENAKDVALRALLRAMVEKTGLVGPTVQLQMASLPDDNPNGYMINVKAWSLPNTETIAAVLVDAVALANRLDAAEEKALWTLVEASRLRAGLRSLNEHAWRDEDGAAKPATEPAES
jgi:hypothetical protein